MPLETMASAMPRTVLSSTLLGELIPAVPAHGRRFGQAVIGNVVECGWRDEIGDGKRIGFCARGDHVIGLAFAVMNGEVKLVALQRAFADIGASLVGNGGDREMLAVNFTLLDDECAPGLFDLAGKRIAGLLQDENHLASVTVGLLDRRHPDAGEVRGEECGSKEKYEKKMFHADKDTA